MNKKLIFNSLILLMIVAGFYSCDKAEYNFGEITAPSDLALTTAIAGADAANPNGNGTGIVNISTVGSKVITYKVDFGDGTIQMVPSGAIQYKYKKPGINEYMITVSAVGTGGVVSNISKKIKVFVAFEIPGEIVANLTGGTSKVWVMAREADAHFGVGPGDAFAPIWYAAGPNARDGEGMYDDEITFAKLANNQVSINVDNKGQTYILGAAVSYYGFSGAEGQYPLVTGGVKTLAFSDASSGSTPAVSTRIEFAVPGNGIVCVGIGSVSYEILSLTETALHLRTIGKDGNSWYQKFIKKP
ncbi:MAG TPA: PKD domain-containing protein [Chitinophagaceae bacterium]|nr:PKD domain-containing protein [Chitinophagaceae bacterium]